MWYVKEGDRWRYYERYEDPLTGKIRRLSVLKPSRSRSDQAAARRDLDELIRKKTATSGPRETMTLGELCEEYVRWQKAHNRSQTAFNADMHCRTLKRCIGKDTLLSRLTDKVVEEKLSGSDVSSITYNERLRRFKSLMRWGYEEGYVSDISYMNKLRRQKAPSTRERDMEKYLEHDEITRLLEGMTSKRWELLTRLLILTGMRVGEALSLDRSDVTDSTIEITKTLNPNGGGVQHDTKTETSTRSISIQDELGELIKEIDIWRDEQQEHYGYDSDILLPDRDGGYLSYQSYRKYIVETSEKILGRRITPHALRHTHVALLAESGMSLGSISRRLGHSDSKVTQQVYMHVTQKMREKDAEQLKGIRLID